MKFDSRIVLTVSHLFLSLSAYIQLSPFPDAFYQLCELFLALRFARRADIVGGSFTVYRRCVPTLPAVWRELFDVSCAGLSLFALVGFKFRFRRDFRARLLTCSYLALRLYTADFAVDVACRRPSHFVGRMRIGIDRGCHRIVTEECCNRLDIDAVLYRHCCEGVTQVVEANVLTICVFQYLRWQ